MADKLTLKQEAFCQLYISEGEFFGNGVNSYTEAYDPDKTNPNWYNVAKVGASENLTKPNILARINELLEADGYNNQFVDKQLKFLMTQNADFSNKLGAIREYNKLKARIEDKIIVTQDITVTIGEDRL